MLGCYFLHFYFAFIFEELQCKRCANNSQESPLWKAAHGSYHLLQGEILPQRASVNIP
jgi:hypothetical protein